MDTWPFSKVIQLIKTGIQSTQIGIQWEKMGIQPEQTEVQPNNQPSWWRMDQNCPKLHSWSVFINCELQISSHSYSAHILLYSHHLWSYISHSYPPISHNLLIPFPFFYPFCIPLARLLPRAWGNWAWRRSRPRGPPWLGWTRRQRRWTLHSPFESGRSLGDQKRL